MPTTNPADQDLVPFPEDGCPVHGYDDMILVEEVVDWHRVGTDTNRWGERIVSRVGDPDGEFTHAFCMKCENDPDAESVRYGHPTFDLYYA